MNFWAPYLPRLLKESDRLPSIKLFLIRRCDIVILKKAQSLLSHCFVLSEKAQYVCNLKFLWWTKFYLNERNFFQAILWNFWTYRRHNNNWNFHRDIDLRIFYAIAHEICLELGDHGSRLLKTWVAASNIPVKTHRSANMCTFELADSLSIMCVLWTQAHVMLRLNCTACMSVCRSVQIYVPNYTSMLICLTLAGEISRRDALCTNA